ncbi:UV radiation resistance protein and autophagy-related subunit 14-domain-containing protein [Colletotrichum navitas]|uniref:Autophagy-related protein 14 n=1 Tax=Colletotrichum navitas TaxID=681940 RepID=A0AAD8Q7X1_9PEZI|nr:UV radiation resistance protein and autophagy-related subunit 14-domain-containing protein [Colletotrichum navitas]KAK1597472.1 UV radiation resistance protein and autophagy-related subunit 14-domain-containing protein [Colletotrichum navitas]
MNCNICQRPHSPQRLPFLCAVDARNHCYEGRLKNLQALMENESLQKQINDLLAQDTTAGAPNPVVVLEDSVSQQKMTEDRTDQIIAQADKLRDEVAAARKEIADRKAAISRRKSDLASASSGITARRTRQLEEAERSISVAKYKWGRNADQMSTTRSFLCKEAAKLYGLRRFKKGSSSRYEFKIGGVDVIDLSSMNATSPEVLSTSLANIAHILALTSHYLTIRLPAEITLPHRDYPRPTIFNLASSYQHGDVPFPGTSTIPSFASDERDSQPHYVPRPRPLFVDKALPILAKEDPATYSLFLEGVTLLAYDIAWACSTQGVFVGDRNSFEDVCHMGRNLYNLLIGQQLHSNHTGRLYPPTTPSPAAKHETPDQEELGRPSSWVGRYSHGTAYAFLGSAEGSEFVRSFKLPSPLKLADKLKKKLVSEVAVPEWEVLEDDAWAIDDGEGQMARAGGGGGTNGWTKVKTR